MIRDNSKKSPAFLFICQPGDLEIKAQLLGYSIRKYYGEKQRFIICIPEFNKNQIAGVTYDFFRKIGGEIFYFKNDFLNDRQEVLPGDAMSNKFCALSQLDAGADIFFLDTDMIFQKPFATRMFEDRSICAKPADFALEIDWERFYRLMKVPMPSRKVTCTVDKQVIPPYYNTGFLYLNRDMLKIVSTNWQESFHGITGITVSGQLKFNLFHRDQLAFALALQKIGVDVLDLSEDFNYPIRRRKQISETCYLVHYHDRITVAQHRELKDTLKEMTATSPSLRKILNRNLEWRLCHKENRFLLFLLIFVKRKLSKLSNKKW